MTKYRDMYPSLFKDGHKVVVLGVSMDADTTLADWASEAHFPMLFASDAGTHAAGSAYGAYNIKYKLDMRLLYVIGPDGKITYVAKPFNVSKTDSYASLGDAVEAVTQ
jgi:peroxiredoxin